MTVKADKPCNGTCVTEAVLRPVNRDWLARRHVMFRGNANNDNCSPRYLNANNRPSNVNANIGCAAQDGFYPFAAFPASPDAQERRIHETRLHDGSDSARGSPAATGGQTAQPWLGTCQETSPANKPNCTIGRIARLPNCKPGSHSNSADVYFHAYSTFRGSWTP